MATQLKTLRKIVYALSESTLDKLVADHERRGWKKASEVKGYQNGIGILMEFTPKRPSNPHIKRLFDRSDKAIKTTKER